MSEMLMALIGGSYLRILVRFCIEILVEFGGNTGSICNFVCDNLRLVVL